MLTTIKFKLWVYAVHSTTLFSCMFKLSHNKKLRKKKEVTHNSCGVRGQGTEPWSLGDYNPVQTADRVG